MRNYQELPGIVLNISIYLPWLSNHQFLRYYYRLLFNKIIENSVMRCKCKFHLSSLQTRTSGDFD